MHSQDSCFRRSHVFARIAFARCMPSHGCRLRTCYTLAGATHWQTHEITRTAPSQVAHIRTRHAFTRNMCCKRLALALVRPFAGGMHSQEVCPCKTYASAGFSRGMPSQEQRIRRPYVFARNMHSQASSLRRRNASAGLAFAGGVPFARDVPSREVCIRRRYVFTKTCLRRISALARFMHSREVCLRRSAAFAGCVR